MGKNKGKNKEKKKNPESSTNQSSGGFSRTQQFNNNQNQTSMGSVMGNQQTEPGDGRDRDIWSGGDGVGRGRGSNRDNDVRRDGDGYYSSGRGSNSGMRDGVGRGRGSNRDNDIRGNGGYYSPVRGSNFGMGNQSQSAPVSYEQNLTGNINKFHYSCINNSPSLKILG